jgi:cyclic beta-1,2-glucan synthetase
MRNLTQSVFSPSTKKLPEVPWRAEVLSREALGELAQRLAEQHYGTFGVSRSSNLLSNYRSNRETLRRVYHRLAEAAHKGEALTAGAEWLLDNYHVVERHAAAIKKYLPPGFYRTLPQFREGPFEGFPRVYHLALEFIVHTDAAVEPSLAAFFISAYQQKLELSSGELWAFPIMLRFALFENLRRLTREAEKELLARRDVFSLVDEVLGDESRTGTEIMVELAHRVSERDSFLPHGALELLKRLRGRGRKAFMALQFLEEALRERGLDPEDLLRAEDHAQAARQISVGNTLTSLKAIDQMNWREWFEDVSLAERILRRDPANLYARCDFPTRDSMRHEIEKLSKGLKKTDSQIAAAVVTCASNYSTSDAADENQAIVQKHVGYFLIGKGRAFLETDIGYTPPPLTRIARLLGKHAVASYLGAIAAISAMLVVYVYFLAEWSHASAALIVCTLLLTALPVSELASSIVQYLITRWIPARPLPKLSHEGAVDPENKTLVAVHTIFSSTTSIQRAIDGLEVRFLSNDDPAFTYALMADLPDARSEHSPGDAQIVQAAKEGIEALNALHCADGPKRFAVFFRKRMWNPGEGVWMAWERKRGKIEELNRYLLGHGETSLEMAAGDPEHLKGIRYVITLDSDSQLSRDVAQKLVATISHPMNRAVVDPETRCVVDGYALIQPRVTISLTSATSSWFSQLFSGQAGLDPYTNVVSDVYQDVFAEGSFVGKGIYDLRTFAEVLEDRVPDNTLLSHDLFEGSFARVGLASDIELYDDFPSRYMAYSKRLHRWVRGDWQLLPWLKRRVPTAKGQDRNPLSALALWKMLDNLRRSLLPPACFLSLVAGWFFLPGGPLAWTAIVLLVIAFPVFTGLANAFALPSIGISIGGFLGDIGRDLWRHSMRAACAVCFLPHQAALMTHAISVTLFRLVFSRRHLLEWEPAERSERRGRNEQREYLRLFLPSMGLAVVAAVHAGYHDHSTFAFSVPLLLAWLTSPWLARLTSQPLEAVVPNITSSQERYLRGVALDTWHFFDDFIREEYHFLMPDNLQVHPKDVIAERTSPTNISLSMLSIVSAYDLGFLPFNEVLRRNSKIVRTLSAMEKYRGHLFNWYNIRTLEPLHPRYISTVDSGNLLGHFFTFLTILERAPHTQLLARSHLTTLLDELETTPSTLKGAEESDSLASELEKLRGVLVKISSPTVLDWLACTSACKEFLNRFSELSTYDTEVASPSLRRLRRLILELAKFDDLLAWITPLRAISTLDESQSTSGTTLSYRESFSRLATLPLTIASLTSCTAELLHSSNMESGGILNSGLENTFKELNEKLTRAHDQLSQLTGDVETMTAQCLSMIKEMDFSFLYDGERALFTIGFNTEHARRDGSFYDLLASEARLLSFLAVARGEVPQKHWFSLGRSITSTPGGKALISWSGTMFEYLMPFIVMRDFPTTLLGRTGRAVVQTQIAYGKRQSTPWGISESAYSGVDFEKTYQYRAFGVPGLGLKRGLSEDLVISPYSTCLALPFLSEIEAGIVNLRYLEREGARGRYGFFEAVDYTPTRHLRTDGKHIVQSFFAHHQGMSLVAITNLLRGDIMCERFHSQPIVKSAELLLHERFPERIATIVPHEPEMAVVRRDVEEAEEAGLEVVTSPHTKAPRVRLLSNGRYSVMVDSSGGGFSVFDRSIMLTRWREDPTTTNTGSFFYVRDRHQGKIWSAAYQPSCTDPDSYEAIFSPGRAEFKRFDDRIFVHTEITVAPEDDVELRRITVTNLGDTERELEISSYIEPTLSPRRADAVHPAFSKLFIRPEKLVEHDALLFSRRPRTEGEQEVYFFHRVTLRTSYAPVRFCTSRAAFIGRGRSLQDPAVFSADFSENNADSGIDPIASLGCTVRLEPGASETLVFVSGASRSRKEAVGLIERYQELMHVSRAFELSWSRAQVELRNHAYSASQADLFHRLAGCLVYSEESVRATPDVLAANRLSQSGLWRFGISGDLPIVLTKVNDVRQGKVVQELLLAHHFLRERGMEFDLVILHKNPGTYMQPLAEDLEYIIRLSPAGHLIDRPGGVFLRSTLQISDAESSLLETVARVVIDAELVSLTELLKSSALEQVTAPPLPAMRKRSSRPSKAAQPLLLSNGLGGFATDDHRYVMPHVGTSRPPLPWSNVIANPSFGFLVTESGGGYTWSVNSRENRITSWSNDPVMDSPSEAIYLRRADTGDYWSLTPLPAGDGLDYHVEHGFGFSSFSTNNLGIESKLQLFCSTTESVKWYAISLANTEQTEQKLELYLYADLVLGVLREDAYRFTTTSFDRTAQTLCAVNYYNNEFAGRVVSLGSSEPIVSYTASRLEFLGRNGNLKRPAALERGALQPFFAPKPKSIKLSATTDLGIDPCAVLQVSVSLKPKEEKLLHFFLADSPSFDAMRRDSVRYRSHQTQRAEFTTGTAWWDELLSSIEIETPSDSFNVMMNGWLLYQTVACRLFGRSGFYQSGGALGFRDQLQDSLALLTIRPEMVRSQILLHAAHQFKEGDVQHWWHPPTGRGVRTRITDDLLWLPYAVSRYVEATGDYSILNERVPFLDGPQLTEQQMETYFVPERAAEDGTILDHCMRTFAITAKTGEHGLPLMGSGDWNDGMNEVGRHGKGESVWLGWFQIHVIRGFIPLLQARGELDAAAALETRATALVHAVEAHGWDGAWYRRAYYDDGTPIGSNSSDECQIDSLSQSWAVISSAAQPARAAQAMQSVRERLVDTDHRIIKLLTPPFDRTEKNPGYIKGYPPGIRENGGQYTHAASWVIIAAALMGRGTEAVELFELINPINASLDAEQIQIYRGEPYVTCGDVYSEGNLSGRAGWSWYTGSAGWLYQAGLEYIIGLKVKATGFTIEPTLPAHWPRVSVKYRRGEREFIITIDNQAGVERGVTSVSVNGHEIADKQIPFESPQYGSTITVKIILG